MGRAKLEGRIGEISVGPSVVVNHKGDVIGEAEIQVTGGSGPSLKVKLADGRKEHQLAATLLGATGFIVFEGSF